MKNAERLSSFFMELHICGQMLVLFVNSLIGKAAL